MPFNAAELQGGGGFDLGLWSESYLSYLFLTRIAPFNAAELQGGRDSASIAPFNAAELQGGGGFDLGFWSESYLLYLFLTRIKHRQLTCG
jgi:hypothetical protein